MSPRRPAVRRTLEDASVLCASDTELQVLAGGMHRLAVLHVIEDRIARLPEVVDDVVALATAAVARRPGG